MSSNRGRPPKKMDTNSIVYIINDMYMNASYFEKLFQNSFDTSIVNFQVFIKYFHERIAATTADPTKLLVSEMELAEILEQYKSFGLSESEINDKMQKYKDRVPCITSEDIEEFQGEVNKLSDKVWIKYQNRLRQQKHREANATKNIPFSHADYHKLKEMKLNKECGTWSELIADLYDDYEQAIHLANILEVEDLHKAYIETSRLLELLDSSSIEQAKDRINLLLKLTNTTDLVDLLERSEKEYKDTWT